MPETRTLPLQPRSNTRPKCCRPQTNRSPTIRIGSLGLQRRATTHDRLPQSKAIRLFQSSGIQNLLRSSSWATANNLVDNIHMVHHFIPTSPIPSEMLPALHSSQQPCNTPASAVGHDVRLACTIDFICRLLGPCTTCTTTGFLDFTKGAIPKSYDDPMHLFCQLIHVFFQFVET
jgi:hypothetical protein